MDCIGVKLIHNDDDVDDDDDDYDGDDDDDYDGDDDYDDDDYDNDDDDDNNYNNNVFYVCPVYLFKKLMNRSGSRICQVLCCCIGKQRAVYQ